MSAQKRFAALMSIALLLAAAALLSRCGNNGSAVAGGGEVDDSLGVAYGPYRIIKLPITEGVRILNPIQLTMGPDGDLYAANQSGEVYILNDTDDDGLEDEASLYCNVSDQGLRSPSGFAHRGDTIYIGTAQEIRIYLDRNKDGKADTSWTFFNDIPYSKHPYEWTSGMNFGPDGWLYFVLSTDSWNAGASPDPKGYRGAILRISPDGKKVERIATGVRSVYGMDFNEYGDLFFVDNEGGGNPKEELDLVVNGGFYGHNPDKYKGHDSIIGPAHVLETEVAPASMTFNAADNNFGGTAGQLFIAFYGPGERWKRGGVGRVRIERRADGSYHYEEKPVADIPKLSALAFGKDGSLYLAHHGYSDYWYNSVQEKTGGFFKIVYDPTLLNKPARLRAPRSTELSASSIEAGKQLFAQRACAACHRAGDGEELIGPNLKGVAKRLSREDILEEMLQPSKIIKPSMAAMRITKKDGQVLLGRVISADEKQLSLMIIGNEIVVIPRPEIAKAENEMKSLMYENLVNGLSDKEISSLLDYISSLK